MDLDRGADQKTAGLLQQEGYAVLSASADQTGRIIAKERADLVLLDVHRRGEEAEEILEAFRTDERWKGVPLILLLARSRNRQAGAEGRLQADDSLSRPFSAEELLTRVRLWLRIGKAEAGLRERNREFSALAESSVALTASLDLDQTLRGIIEISGRLWSSRFANILLLNEKGELVLSVQSRMPEEWVEELRSHPLKLGESLAGWVAQQKTTLFLPDPSSDPRCDPSQTEFCKKFEVHSYLGVPLLAGKRLIGVLNFGGDRGHSLFPNEIELVAAFAQHAAMAIDNARAYAQVREAMEYFQNVVDNSQDAIINVNSEGMITLWNKGAELIYGYSSEEALGKFVGIIIPEGFVEEERNRLGRIGHRGSGVNYRGHRRRKDGQTIPVLVTWSPVRDEKGAIQAISSIHKDLSDLYRLETLIWESKRKLMAVLDGITDFVYEVDRDFRITQINRAYASCLDQSPPDLVGRPCYKSLRGLASRCPDCLVPQILEKADSLRGERREAGKGSQERIWEVSAFPVMARPGVVSQVVHQLKDITEKRKLEWQVAQAEKLASLGQLAGGVAHEINNPLASLSIYTELLRRKERIDEEGLRFLEGMEENVERMAKIVRGLLDFSRPASAHLRPVDLREILKSSLEILNRQALLQEVEITSEWPGHLPMIRGEAMELEQVFFHLLLNAAQAMSPGGHIWITAKRASEKFVEVSVKDSGSGIPPEELSRIFDPFFTTKPPGAGTGLGLSVVRRIIENHRGRIWVESEVDRGSTFTFLLPTSDEGGYRKRGEEQRPVVGKEEAS